MEGAFFIRAEVFRFLQSAPSTTGYRVYTCLNNWLQVTECTGWYWLHSLVHLPQQLVTECTSWYWIHSLVHLPQQLVTECTGWYGLHSLVHMLQPTGYKSTNRVLATQSLLKSASPQRVT